MPRVARKVTLAKWRGIDGASPASIPADAISVDLRTQSNTLSFWRAQDDTTQAEDSAVLAIVGSLQRLDTIDIAMVDESEFADYRIEVSDGDTFVSTLKSLHRDVAGLDHNGLRAIAEKLAVPIYNNTTRRITRRQLKEIIMSAVAEKKVEIGTLPPGIKEAIEAKNG